MVESRSVDDWEKRLEKLPETRKEKVLICLQSGMLKVWCCVEYVGVIMRT